MDVKMARLRNDYVTEWEEGWLQVKVPVPFSLRWVNAYLIPDSAGYTMVDPGLKTDEALRVWDFVLEQAGIANGDIQRIVLTHQHPDHYGLAGTFQQRTGAPVYMSRDSHRYALRLWGEDSVFSADLQQLYRKHGMPAELLAAIDHNLGSFAERVSPQPQVSYLEAGGKLQLGDREWSILDARGHATGQLVFYQPDLRWMLCGDQVLPHISPNVSLVPGDEEDPLHSILLSWEELLGYDVSFAYPGHRDPFEDFSGRIRELLQHHARRLTAIQELIAHRARTGFQMCEELFGERLRDNPHNLRFAMSETLAHLVYLARRGQITETIQEETITYNSIGDGNNV
ncbi:MBL fold metallo-hydrolase [Paenibacillus sp. GCM10023252]|uniref:MBL fold metallo-hydrolase n=1 Tax=Paenibacillus sp. GCM10023252 TaxID=3252649 RepID=UPI003621DCE2